MKKVVLVLFAFLFFSVGQAFAYRVTDFSTDAKIVAAMRVLEQAGENDVFRNLQRYGMRIKFDDLSMVMNGKNAYAVSTYNNFADLEEETLATSKEAACWTRVKVASKVYPVSRLTRRLDKISGLYLASSSNNNLVQQKIASNGFYRNQLGLN